MKEDSVSQFTDVTPLRPLKLTSEFREPNLTAEGLVCGSAFPRLPNETADPIKKVVVDVAAISHCKGG